MSDQTFFAKTIEEQKYCHDKPNGTKESWVEVSDRVGTSVTKPYLPEITEFMVDRIGGKEFLPGGRYLYAAGRKYPQINNCLDGETEFITDEGVRKLKDCVEETVVVWNRFERWEQATVKAFGQQQLYEVIFSNDTKVHATANHRWWTTDGRRIETTELDTDAKILFSLKATIPDLPPVTGVAAFVTAVSVKPTDRVEEVYCVVAPESESFTLADGIVTSNCFLFSVEEDSREAWGTLMNDATNGLMTGGGIGVVYSKLREEDAPVGGLGGKSTGPCALMQMVNEAGRHIMQGGSRRCLPAGSLVHTYDGLVPIERIRIGDKVLTGDGSFCKVKAKFDQGQQRTVYIQSQLGRFECTPNHRVAVMAHTNGDYIWKQADQLEEGDRLVFIEKAVPGCDTELPNFSYPIKKMSTTCKPIKIPRLTTEIAWLIGAIQGDGYVRLTADVGKGHISITFGEHETAEINRAVTAIEEFGLQARIAQGDGKCKTVKSSSVQLATYMYEHVKQPKMPLQVPEFILKGSVDIRAAYVAGLIDTDGCVGNRPIVVVASVYPEFVKQLQAVCASIGIATRVKLNRPAKDKWQAQYHLTLSSREQISKFVKLVGKFSCKEQELQEAQAKRKYDQYSYSLPIEMVLADNELLSLRSVHQSRQADVTVANWRRVKNPTHNRLPVKVTKVIDSEHTVQTYDIEVEERNEFVVNGLLVHNSAIFASLHWNHPDALKFCKLKNWQKEVRELKEKDFNFPAPMDLTNISIILDDDFFKAFEDVAHKLHKTAQDVFWLVCYQMCKTGEPGFSIDVGVNAGEHLRNAPVTASTRVLTNEGYRRVGEIVNVPTTIWTGRQWAEDAVFKCTMKNAPIVKVSMSNNRYIRCEPNHEFLIRTAEYKEARVPAKNLQVGQQLYVAEPYYSSVEPVKVLDVEEDGFEDVYCADVKCPEHSFMAEGVIIANCTEITSRDNGDVCNLGSINLSRFDSIDRFAETVWNATGFLICGTLYGVLPLEKMHKVREKNRRLGLGLMGLHEWLLIRGKRYGPDEELGKWLQIYKDVSDKAAIHWCNKLGISNCLGKRAIAPTGTISIVARTTGGGEPIFAVAIKRRYLKGKVWHYQYVIDGAAERIIKRGVDPDIIEDAYQLAEDVERRMDFQVWLQKYVDHAISSTINMPRWGTSINNAETVKRFGEKLYKRLPFLRGITTYPDGARGGQPLNRVSYATAIKHLGKEHTEEVVEELTNNNVCANGVCGV